MHCPVCPNTNLVMAERQGIEIDYCPNCRGVWLDRGELDKIIERTVAQDSTPTTAPPTLSYQQPYQHHHGKDQRYSHGSGHGHPYKKKKTLLSELFDFD